MALSATALKSLAEALERLLPADGDVYSRTFDHWMPTLIISQFMMVCAPSPIATGDKRLQKVFKMINSQAGCLKMHGGQ